MLNAVQPDLSMLFLNISLQILQNKVEILLLRQKACPMYHPAMVLSNQIGASGSSGVFESSISLHRLHIRLHRWAVPRGSLLPQKL